MIDTLLKQKRGYSMKTRVAMMFGGKTVEHEVRIDLHTHRKELGLLLLDLRLLVYELIVIYRLDKLSVPDNQVIVAVHEMRYLIGTLDVIYRNKSNIVSPALENLIELPESVGKRLVYKPHQKKRKKDIDRKEQNDQRNMILKRA